MRVNIDGLFIEVDGVAELKAFEWKNAEWKDDRLIACSPFREDNKPSFYVYLTDTDTAYGGAWGDSGGTGIYKRGSFLSLLSFLREETIEETKEYLLEKYAGEWSGHVENLAIDLNIRLLKNDKKREPLNKSMLKSFYHPCEYLERRGIHSKVKAYMQVGYYPEKKAIAIPWFYNGELVNIKYRSIEGKMFWYQEGGWPIRELVYGLDVINRRGLRDVVVCEAEIDALYCMSNGQAAIALGGSKLSDEKIDLIMRSPIECLRIATDNDEAGEELRDAIWKALGSRIKLYDVRFPKKYKDLNDIRNGEELRGYISTASGNRNFLHRYSVRELV